MVEEQLLSRTLLEDKVQKSNKQILEQTITSRNWWFLHQSAMTTLREKNIIKWLVCKAWYTTCLLCLAQGRISVPETTNSFKSNPKYKELPQLNIPRIKNYSLGASWCHEVWILGPLALRNTGPFIQHVKIGTNRALGKQNLGTLKRMASFLGPTCNHANSGNIQTPCTKEDWDVGHWKKKPVSSRSMGWTFVLVIVST